jgi:hypothetical protein
MRALILPQLSLCGLFVPRGLGAVTLRRRTP